MNTKITVPLHKKQTGATLFTALTFLLLMTIVTVSASKISMQDTFVAKNTQQKQLLFQQTANDLNQLATAVQLLSPMLGTGGAAFNDATGIYTLPADSHKVGTTQTITDMNTRLNDCSINGLATSIGPSNSLNCYLYDFNVNSRSQTVGGRDKHNRGAGRELPNPILNNALNN